MKEPKPTIGRIVLYVCQSVDPIGFRTLPAIVFEEERESPFTGFLLTGLAVIMPPHFNQENGAAIHMCSLWARHDEGRAIGTWHWPPREDPER